MIQTLINRASTRTLLVLIIVIGAAAIVVYSWPQSPVEEPAPGADSNLPTQDEQFRELVIGQWQDDFKGRRNLTVRADGTATMVVEPEGLGAFFAERLTFHEEWSISEGQLQMTAIGGEPKGRVNLILKNMGTESVQKILELTNQRMLLLDADEKTEYDWRRVE